MLVITGMALLFAMLRIPFLRSLVMRLGVFVVLAAPMILAALAGDASSRWFQRTRGFARRSAAIVAMAVSAIAIVVGCVLMAVGITVLLMIM